MASDPPDDQDQQGKKSKKPLEKGNPKLRVLPTALDLIDPENPGAEDEEVVLVRRIDKRLAAREKDFPWVRRVLGFSVIALAFYLGWTMLNRKSEEILRIHAQQKKEEARRDANYAAAHPSPSASSEPILKPILNGRDLVPSVALDGPTVAAIAECTKGVNAFRQLDLDPAKAAKGEATLETVMAPAFIESRGSARRTVNLQNIRIRAKNGEEWRLHASPKTQNGQLYLKLFRVASDGLPEEIPFPDSLKDLSESKLSDEAVQRFLQESNRPGEAIEIERHEAWSYPEKAGAQVILSDGKIFDLQVFMRDRFLACNRGSKAGEATISCKCVERGSSQL